MARSMAAEWLWRKAREQDRAVGSRRRAIMAMVILASKDDVVRLSMDSPLERLANDLPDLAPMLTAVRAGDTINPRDVLAILEGTAQVPGVQAQDGTEGADDLAPVVISNKPVIEILGKKVRNKYNSKPMRCVRVNGENDTMPEKQAEALIAVCAGKTPNKDAWRRCRKWLEARDLPTAPAALDVRRE